MYAVESRTYILIIARRPHILVKFHPYFIFVFDVRIGFQMRRIYHARAIFRFFARRRPKGATGGGDDALPTNGVSPSALPPNRSVKGELRPNGIQVSILFGNGKCNGALFRNGSVFRLGPIAWYPEYLRTEGIWCGSFLWIADSALGFGGSRLLALSWSTAPNGERSVGRSQDDRSTTHRYRGYHDYRQLRLLQAGRRLNSHLQNFCIA